MKPAISEKVHIFVRAFCLILCLGGCNNYYLFKPEMTDGAAQAIERRFETMVALADMPGMPKVTVRYMKAPDWERAGQADCIEWEIILNYYFVADNLAFSVAKLVPHEYAHMMSCYSRGHLGADPHDNWWKEAVVQLGGDPEYI